MVRFIGSITFGRQQIVVEGWLCEAARHYIPNEAQTDLNWRKYVGNQSNQWIK